MQIVVDAAIALASEALGDLGEVRALQANAITADAVRDADAVVVRSVTRIDDALVHGSRVRFVGTATVGTDHLDLAALERRGIAVASAAGCNADAVADYVVTAHALAIAGGHVDPVRAIGVIGFGHIGRRVTRRFRAMGQRVMVVDPPLRRGRDAGLDPPGRDPLRTMVADEDFVDLDRALASCGVITLHVPLLHDGPDRTARMIDAAALAKMPPAAMVINTARGPAVKSDAMVGHLAADRGHAILDVWEREPTITVGLAEQVIRGTQHIAGYSRIGKRRATQWIHEALCRHVGRAPHWQAPTDPPLRLTLDLRDVTGEHDAVARALRTVCDLDEPWAALRRSLTAAADARARAFEALRRGYPLRRQTDECRLRLVLAPALDGDRIAGTLRAAGFADVAVA